MADIERVLVKKETINKLLIPPGSRSVLVKVLNDTMKEKTDSGIIKIAPTDAGWSPSTHRNRHGTVMAVPKDPLPFREGEDEMPWKTTVQISIGMVIWFDFMDMQTFEDEHGDEYKLVDYDSVYVASFPRVESEEIDGLFKSTDGTEWILPVNGFSLFEFVHKKQRGKFDIFGSEKVDPRKGVVKYVAKNNEAYDSGLTTDHVDLEVGDVVRFNNVPAIRLEDEYHAFFDGGRMYRRAQARNIDLVWRGEELILPKGKVLISQILDEEITPAGIILLKTHVKNHTGTVIISSSDQVEVGQEICYICGAGEKIEHEGKEVRVLNESQILYVK